MKQELFKNTKTREEEIMNEVVNAENINEIEVIGITEVDGMKFHDIEGGFGECKKQC